MRIVVVGASTVVDLHHLPYSWPEYLNHWFQVWTKSNNLDATIEVLNAGRESIWSPHIAAIVRTEVVPLKPDLVVYHAGGNQFDLASIVPRLSDGPIARPAVSNSGPLAGSIATIGEYSALAGRFKALLEALDDESSGGEWPKPVYDLVWPKGLDEMSPDPYFPQLSVNLNAIIPDLDRIRSDLSAIGSQLTVSSFVWMVRDGLVLDPIRHKYIIEGLNVGKWPYRYRDLERLAKFQNRVFQRYANLHHLPFIDIARFMPVDADLFTDAVHVNDAGGRVRAWVAFNLLVPLIREKLAARTWPRIKETEKQTLPTFAARLIQFSCKD